MIHVSTPPPPSPFVLSYGPMDTRSSFGGIANQVLFVPVYTPGTFALAAVRMNFQNGGNGYYDVGIYDATGANDDPGNLLAHAAATNTSLPVPNAGTQALTPALIGGAVALAAGRYWLAYWQSSSADQIVGTLANTGMPTIRIGNYNGPLPALASSVTGLTNANFYPMIEGLRVGGWS